MARVAGPGSSVDSSRVLLPTPRPVAGISLPRLARIDNELPSASRSMVVAASPARIFLMCPCAPLKPCAASFCSRRATHGRFCQSCGQEYDEQFYSRAPWRRFRRRFLEQNPFCEDCLTLGEPEEATEVHHIKKRSTHPELALEPSNCKGLCSPCHTRRTRRGE